MAGMNYAAASPELIRADVWGRELKDLLRDEMMAQKYVRLLTEFPDGDTFHIPQIGEIVQRDYTEDTAVTYDPLAVSDFTFTIDKYLSSATYLTKKAAQDSFYAAELTSRFVPEQERAIMVHFEQTTMAAPEVGVSANDELLVNGLKRRFAAGGTGAVITLEDFARARYILKKQNVPDTDLIALVDPSVEYTINTLQNLTNVSNNPRFEGIVSNGIATGMRFVANVYGFDVYTSNYLDDATDSGLEVGGSATTVDFSSVNGKVNLFFSAAAAANPFIGAWRQMPEVDYEYEKDYQRHEYVTTARYGVKLYRPENMVRVISKTAV